MRMEGGKEGREKTKPVTSKSFPSYHYESVPALSCFHLLIPNSVFFYHFSLNLEHSIHSMHPLNFYTYSEAQVKGHLPNEVLSVQINITSFHLHLKKTLAIFLEFILQLMISQSAFLWQSVPTPFCLEQHSTNFILPGCSFMEDNSPHRLRLGGCGYMVLVLPAAHLLLCSQVPNRPWAGTGP